MGDRFKGRRVLVTGSSRGIGAGIAERMAAEGADVVLTARTLDKHEHLAGSLTETAERLSRYGTKVGIVVADLTDPVDRQRVIPEAVEALGGPVEILVNNAAASIQKPLVEVSVKRRNIMFEVNVNAPLDLVAGRRARHGRGRRGLDRQPVERQRQPLARARHRAQRVGPADHRLRRLQGRAQPHHQRPGRPRSTAPASG